MLSTSYVLGGGELEIDVKGWKDKLVLYQSLEMASWNEYFNSIQFLSYLLHSLTNQMYSKQNKDSIKNKSG